MSRSRHGYVAVGSRLVHYTARGEGQVVVLLHASPADSRTLEPLIRELATDCCVVALDTPGHGLSDPIDVAEPTVDDYGARLLETLVALRLPVVHLYGTHTGAKIALSAALQAPAEVASLTLDGIGVSTADEREDQLARYTVTWRATTDGSHLVQAWHQARNMFLFWPWYAENPARALPGAMIPVDDLHTIAHGMLQAGDQYPLAYRAAFRFDPTEALAAVDVPTTIVAAPDDPLRAHLDRLATLSARVRIDATATDLAARIAVIRAQLKEHAAATEAGAGELPSTSDGRRFFTSTPLGEVHGSAGDPQPAETLVLAPLGARLDAAAGARDLVLELPGTGRSTLDSGAELNASRMAESVVVAAEVARPTSVRCTASTAAVGRAVAELLGVPRNVVGPRGRFDEDLFAHLRPRPDGAHLLAAWHVVREAAITQVFEQGCWPGACGDAPDLALLHDRAVSLAGSWRTLAAVYAVSHDTGQLPPAATGPGEFDPLAGPAGGRA